MKKIFIYILFSFIISGTSFAKKSGCTDGDCNNGFGTWTYTDKTTYVGQWEYGSKKGKGTETSPNGYVYDGDFNDRRVLTYTMSFTAKFYLYGPVTDQKVIKQVQVDQYTDMPVNAPKREQRYSVTPSPQSAEADDNFGFNETTSFFEDAKNYDEKTGTDTDDA